uniref:Uncharacterized protein n=1 Tax=Acrobeloides nanus TaxID=290746 RepID=A0A914CJ80_9BILA
MSRPQVFVRKSPSASLRPQMSVRKSSSASLRPQMSRPQVFVRKSHTADELLGPRIRTSRRECRDGPH